MHRNNNTIDTATQQALTGTVQQAIAGVQQATTQAGSTAAPALPKVATAAIPAGQDLDEVLVHAVGLNYENAVNAQQQVNITQQAASTMLISTLISVVTATLSVAVKKAES